MTRSELFLSLGLALGIATFPASSLRAAQLFWEGTAVTGNLTDANYFNLDLALSAQAPTSADQVHVGNDGIANLSTPGDVSFINLRAGHNQQSGYNGPATVTISGGATLNLIGDGSTPDGNGANGNAAKATLWVGNNQNGSVLNIDGEGTSVISANGVAIGVANSNPGRAGTLNITNGGALRVTAGTIKLGERSSGSNAMDVNAGHLNVDGIIEAPSMYVGMRDTTSTFTQTGGTVSLTGVIEVAPANSGANNQSVFNLSGGTFTLGGNFFLGRGDSTGATANITGGELNVGNRYLMGGQNGTGIVTNHSGGALNTTLDVRVGDGSLGTAIYNLSGTGVINSTTGGIVGRQGTAQFVQTGGTANFNAQLSIGNREVAPGATSGLYEISAGVLNAGANTGGNGLNIAPNGAGEFRVVGDDADINVLGNFLVGNTENGLGTLAFEFETGDLLSSIDVVDAATFSMGSKLVLDVTNAAPTQLSYDLLTAASIDDQGLVFEGPAGWTHQIVAGGNGQILRAVGPGSSTDDADFDGDGDVDGRDLLAWQRGLGGDPTKANGNANGDSAVDGADLVIWKSQFSATSVPAAAAIPEPGSAALLAAAFGLLGVRLRPVRGAYAAPEPETPATMR